MIGEYERSRIRELAREEIVEAMKGIWSRSGDLRERVGSLEDRLSGLEGERVEVRRPPNPMGRCVTCGSTDQLALLFGIPPHKWWKLLEAAKEFRAWSQQPGPGYLDDHGRAVIQAIKDMQP